MFVATMVARGFAVVVAVNDPHQPERWADGLKLVGEIRHPSTWVAELPLILRLTSHLAARSVTLSRIGTVVLRYRF